MKHLSIKLSALIIIFLANFCNAFAQTAESDSLFSQGRRLYLAGKYDAALSTFTRLLALDRESLPALDEVIGFDNHWIAACHFKKGNETEARSFDPNYFDLEPVDRIASRKAIDYSRSVINASSLDMAKYWASRCLDEERDYLGEDHYYLFGSYCVLAGLNYRAGDSTEGRKYIALAKEIEAKYATSRSAAWRATVHGIEMALEAALGHEEPMREALATAWQMIDGDILANPSIYKECLQYILALNALNFSTAQINSIISSTQSTLLTIDPARYQAYIDLVRLINNYCITTHQPRSAIAITEAFLKITPESDVNYDNLLCDLGRLYTANGEYDKGIETINRGFAIAKSIYPYDPSQWVEYFIILGQAYDNAHMYDKSMDMYEQAAGTFKKLGNEYISPYIQTFHARAAIASRTNHYSDAIVHLGNCLKEMDKTDSGSDIDRAYIYKELGYCHLSIDSTKALDYFRQSRAIYEAKNLTRDNDTYNDCRIYELQLKKVADWRPVIDSLCNLCVDGTAMSQHRKIDLLMAYANHLGETYRMPEALEVIEKAEAIGRSLAEYDITNILQSKALCLASTGHPEEATEIARSLYDSTIASHGRLSLQHAAAVSFSIMLSDRTLSTDVFHNYPALADELLEFTNTLPPADPLFLIYSISAARALTMFDTEKARLIAASTLEKIPQRILDSNVEYAASFFSLLSALERTLGNTDLAVTYTSQLLGYVPRLTSPIAILSAYNEAGQTFFAANRLKEAEEMYLKAVETGENAPGTVHDLMVVYQNIAAMYGAIGQSVRQSEFIVKRREIAEMYGNNELVDATDRMSVLWTKYDVGLKEECWNDILAIERFTNNFANVSDASLPLRLKSDFFFREQKLDSATVYIDQALKLAPNTFENLEGAAKVYGTLQQYDHAIGYAERAIDVIDSYNDSNPMLFVAPYKQLGDLQQLNKDYVGSLESYRYCFEASRMHISSNLLTLTARQRADFWNSNSAFYNTYLPLAAATLPYPEKITSLVYDAALFANGLLLSADNSISSLIQNASPEIKQLYSESVAKKELFKKMDEDLVQFQLSRPKENESDESVRLLFEKKDLVDRCEKESENAERALMTALRTAYPSLQEFKNHTWDNVQRNLPSHSAAIEYLDFPIDSTRNAVAALVVKKGMAQPAMRVVYHYPRGRHTSTSDIYTSTALGDSLITSLSDLLADCNSVYFAPQGMLCTVALESLPRSQSEIPSDLKLYRVSSTRVIAEKKPHNKNFNATLFGGLNYKLSVDSLEQDAHSYPALRNRGFVADNFFKRAGNRESDAEIPELPGTLAEVRSISTLLKDKKRVNPRVLVGNRGTESAFKALSGAYGNILHVSTHGFFNEATDNYTGQASYEDFALEQSGLLLAGAENLYLNGLKLPDEIDDGILKSAEISRLDLSGVDLAILSACETALGNVTGNGVFGLQRGFKKAGVNSLLMSLWKVDDDATSALMTEFYTHWLAGRSKYESLELAKLHVKSNPKWENPRYWAAFILLDGLD